MAVNLGSAYGEIVIGTEGAEASVQSLASSLQSTGKTLSLAVSAPLIGVGTAALVSAAGFEQSMNVMQQVSGATASQMQALQDQALQLGAETSFSAGEAASAMLELAKAGLSADEVTAAIGGTMDLAAAGGLDLASAAEITANAVNSFGLEAGQANSVANLLAAAANASSVEVTDLASGMQMASAVFAASGQSIETLNTALALLGNNGLKGSDAGTSLKTMMMRLTAPTDEAAAVMENLGVSVYDAEGKMRNLPDIMAEMQQALYGTNAVTVTSSNLTADQAARMDYLKGTIEKTQRQLADYQSGIAGVAQSENDKAVAVDRLNRVLTAAQGEYAQLASVGGTTSTVMRTLTEEQRTQALTAIFGADAIRAVNILLKEGETGWTDMAAALGDESAAADVANARMQGMSGAIEYFKGSVDSFLIGSALPFLDSISGIVRQAADMISLFGTLSPQVKNAALAFGAVLASAGPLAFGLAKVGAVLSALLSPLGLIVLAVGAVAAAFAIDFLGIRTMTVQAAIAIQGGLLRVATAIRQYLSSAEIQRFASQAQGAFNKVVTAARELASGQTDVGSFVEKVKGAFGSIDWTPVTAPFEGLKTKVVDAFNAIATYDYGAAFTSLRDAVVAKVTAIDWTPVTTGFEGLKTKVVGAVTGIDWVGSFNAAVDAVNGLRDGVIGWLSSAIGGINWQGLSLDFAGFVSSIGDKLRSVDWSTVNPIALLMPLVGRLVPGLGPAISTAKWIISSENFAGLVRSIQTAIAAIDWGAIGTALLGLVESVRAAIVGLDWASLATTAETVKAQIVALFTGMTIPSPTVDTSGIAATIAEIQTVMAPAFARLQESLGTLPASMAALWPHVEALGQAFGRLQPIVEAIGKAAVVAANLGVNLLAAAIKNLPGIVGPIIDQLTATINLIATIFTGVSSAISSIAAGDWAGAWASVQGIVQGFKDFYASLFENLSTFTMSIMTAISDAVLNTLRDIGVDVDPILNGLKATWDSVFNSLNKPIDTVMGAIQSLWDKVRAFADWWNGLKLGNPLEAVGDLANQAQGALGGVGQGVNDAVGGIGQAWNDLTGQGNAEGASSHRGGLAWVGERGPEMVVMPPGAQVLTNGQANRRGGTGDGRVININLGGVTVKDDLDVHRLGYQLATLLEGFGA